MVVVFGYLICVCEMRIMDGVVVVGIVFWIEVKENLYSFVLIGVIMFGIE